MIYSEAIDGLPLAAKAAAYTRIWEILLARSPEIKYQRWPKQTAKPSSRFSMRRLSRRKTGV